MSAPPCLDMSGGRESSLAEGPENSIETFLGGNLSLRCIGTKSFRDALIQTTAEDYENSIETFN